MFELRADCTRCVSLCCVAPAFTASSDFAIDKPAGRPCPNLQADFRCGIHTTLRKDGFPGCSAYDCFGAGQRVTQVAFGGGDWRQSPDVATQMFHVFGIMRQLHELLYYLAEAETLLAGGSSLGKAVAKASEDTLQLAALTVDELRRLDPAAHRQRVAGILREVSEELRADLPSPDHSGTDLAGADLQGANLRGASLRGTLLIGADLRGADLTMADFTGADLRGAQLAGATLTDAIFLTQSQIETASGDLTTTLSPMLTRPSHWRP